MKRSLVTLERPLVTLGVVLLALATLAGTALADPNGPIVTALAR